MNLRIDRRAVMIGTAASVAAPVFGASLGRAAQALAAGTAAFGEAQKFSFELLQAKARQLANEPYAPQVTPAPDTLDAIDYDQYQKIKFRTGKSLRLGADGAGIPVQLFHLGKYVRDVVRVHVVENGQAREAIYSGGWFDIPAGHPAEAMPDGAGFAGFRVMAADLKTDWFAALGASYFRSSGPYNQYGLSARGIAIDTAMPTPEEFPCFREYWLEGGASDEALTIYALLDGPSLAGAYKMQTTRTTDARGVHRVVMEIDAVLFARKDIARLGIAPFSSMFWYGEASRKQSADWRPEIHDSDGLSILTGSGERIWRPVSNPPRVQTSTFIDSNVKGFGLLQRDRDFVHYLDDGVFYERRPSVWVEPLDAWGRGAVHLVEIPTDEETNDNIVAYWCPDEQLKAGGAQRWRYRLTWLDDIEFPIGIARATGTWTGRGGRPGHKNIDGLRKFVIDFQGPVFQGLSRTDGVELNVTASRGEVSGVYNHPVVDQTERWRALFDIEASGSEPVDLRAYLSKDGRALSETWIYQYFPES